MSSAVAAAEPPFSGNQFAGPQWVWASEVVTVVDRRMKEMQISLGELARRAHDRFQVGPESVERRVRAARREGGVMSIHTADRYMVLLDCHLTDLPSYRQALAGELPFEEWPTRSSDGRIDLNP